MCDVNIATGELERSQADVYLPGYLPIEFTRIYYSGNSSVGFLGPGWRHSFDRRLRRVQGGFQYEDGFGDSVTFEQAPGATQLSNAARGYTLSEGEGTLVLGDDKGLRFFFAPLGGVASESAVSLIVDGCGNTQQFHYDRGSPSFSVSDQLGRVVTVERDSSGRLRSIRAQSRDEREVIETRYAYDQVGRLTSVADPLGHVTSYEYDGHLMVKEVLPDGTEIFWRYDESGRCVETWRTGGVLYRRLEFDDARNRVRVTNALGFVYVYQKDEHGTLVQEIDPTGDVSETYIDMTGETLGESRNGQADGHSVVFDSAANRMEMSQPFGTFVYQFNNDDRLASISSETGGAWTFVYGPLGETVREERPGGTRFSAEYAQQGWVRRVMDQSGYYIEQERSDDRRQIRLFDPYGTLCATRLDGFGRLRSATDDFHPVRLDYDKLGRLVRIQAADLPGLEASYDTNDNITRLLTETGQEWRYRFGSTGVLEQVVNPAGARSDFAYDAEQQLIYIRKPNGEEIRVEYDELGRPAVVHLPDGTTESYTYDLFSALTSVSLNGRLQRTFSYVGGQLAEIQYADGARREFDWLGGLPSGGRYAGHAVERQFDERSRLLEERSGSFALVLSYDPADNLTRVACNDGRRIDFSYDGRKRVTSIDDTRCGAHRFTYEAGFEMSEWHVDGGCVVRFTHDPTGLLKGFVVTAPGKGVVAEHSTTYAPDGKVLSEAFRSAGEEIAVNYRYDAAGRPIEAVNSRTGRTSFRYDDNDNVVFSSELGDCFYTPGDRFVRGGDVSYEYDELGRVIQKRDPTSRSTYTYSSASELKSVVAEDGTRVAFDYDAFGRLRSRSVGGVETVVHWLDNVILSEAGEGYQRDYLFLPTTFFCIAVNDSRFGRAFLCPDRTGSPVCMISFDGTILWRRDFRLLGSAPEGRDTARLTSPIGFLGQYREPFSGLDYNWARFYDATTGRYLTPDPIGLSAGTNLYAYAADPLVGVDPYGLFVVNLGAPPMWCKWNRQQRKEYRDKVNRYNAYIAAQETSPGQGIQVTACARTGSKASQQWASSKCCNRKPPKQKKPKGSGGSSVDCTKDIDHIIDCQLGGPQTCPAVCNNLIPVNSSVNQSFGPTMESQLQGMSGQFLTQVTFSPARCKAAKPRTPSCV
jgi:RHS repeat-associated protein